MGRRYNSRRMRWAGYAVGMVEVMNGDNTFIGIAERKTHAQMEG
jgi:hypothetical protein